MDKMSIGHCYGHSGLGIARKLRESLFAMVASLLILAVPLTGSADTIFGLHGSAHLWRPVLSGNIGQSSDSFDLSSEFSEDEGSSVSVLVALEHPIPLIPNVQLRQTPLNWEGSSDSASGTLDGVITISGAVDAELDMEMLDGTLYYEVLDNWVSLDLGLSARQLDGFFSVKLSGDTSGAVEKIDVNTIVPMLYAHARFDLPFSGLAAGVRGNGAALRDNSLIDLEAYLHLEVDLLPLLDVGIQGGLRRLQLDIDESGWRSEASLDGAYISLTGHF